jgi:sugar-phosphatase
MCRQTTGLRIEEVVHHWRTHYPWYHRGVKEVADEIIFGVCNRIKEAPKVMEGVDYILEFFKSRNMKMALASSSAYVLIHTVIEALGIGQYFEFVYSADEEQFGKPDPGIYRSALRKLRAHASECLAFEDSYNGVLAAKGAGIRTIAIPEPSSWSQSRFDIADLKLRSLLEFDEVVLDNLNRAI